MSSMRRTLALAGLTLIVAGCASQPRSTSSSGSAPSPQASKGGGYYQNDGPPDDENIDLASIPDAIPRDEPYSRYGNPASYEALGKTYYVLPSAAGFTQTGRASWYGKQFHGRRTSSGEPYNMFKMTAAHKRLPIPSYVRVTNLDTGKQVIVRVNDRGPFHDGRIIDLSYVAARRLDVVAHGSVPVRIETVTPASLKAEQRAAGRTTQSAAAKPPLRRETQRAASPPGPASPAAPAASTANSPGRAIKVANRTHSAPTSAAATSAEGTLYLQTGAFGNPTNAQRLHRRLQNAGFQRVNVVESGGATPIYRVQLGPYPNERSRALNRQILREQGFSAEEVDR
ncbi:Septal ring lipoprotein RlpA [Salinisphaera shabanensis E1L3A]|uniref:Endolytic peptidoglycan transglycosylase RlpA n=1 Tax=Salinisphaera shabanensis E1L3A TaxID=1033802 RepID=U2FP72_9GAMM|nr:septal ring lytic transglycosylase RlpA family protein [Salinisphaera shabanensis]ERJ17969.1 Septal ring lipoprotein RlpA [Salinisphaera shabanensis E1L3A]